MKRYMVTVYVIVFLYLFGLDKIPTDTDDNNNLDCDNYITNECEFPK